MKHIEKRRNGYYANLRVPEDIKDQIGKVRYFQSLKTTDPMVAQERVGALISKWKAEIRNARLGGLPEDREELLEQIKSERDEQPEDGLWLLDDLVSDLAIERNDPEFFAEATGRRTKTTLYLDEYLASLDDQAPKTVDAKRSDILRFAATFKFFETITTTAAKQISDVFQDIDADDRIEGRVCIWKCLTNANVILDVLTDKVCPASGSLDGLRSWVDACHPRSLRGQYFSHEPASASEIENALVRPINVAIEPSKPAWYRVFERTDPAHFI